MNVAELIKLFERLTKERFFGKLEIKFRDGHPYFCIRQEVLKFNSSKDKTNEATS